MKTLIVLIILLIPKIAYSEQIAYYDPDTKAQIVDVSGLKTQEQIESEFNLKNLEWVVIDEKTEAVRVENGSFVKYNFIDENKAISDQKKAERKTKKENIKTKLNLNESDWKNLLDALGIND